ncbi:bifunctional diaminohydroxyphosphoribosylaminopyrimidine deaminase/5-amino-6-(5-phosphoribosylamino)uracil reductase RibD [Lactobacillus delbrueckii]|uniref:bifunctional diaminohydroxyphosphoribosylaminopyrimidine deaminase/5-amino-6-(5-phosphoribosylamino)uracil reductase RibD n=1 Tax=Lactobacillus delbrueckii TaxID=1584 RepID=UPI0025A2BE22|nr:deaminase [Lactobacillus delbrueckii]MDM7512933.1 deaminase [Lactobacillus delbrueckii]
MTPEQLSNSTIYVTLEPCCHYGKQPPCTQLIIDSGIKRVVVGATDPHSLVTGKGIAALRQAGLEVSTGLLAKEASQLNDHYNYFYQTGLPYVTLKQAMTLDHMLAKKGERTAITVAEAWTRVHHTRNGLVPGCLDRVRNGDHRRSFAFDQRGPGSPASQSCAGPAGPAA